jgi:hypothetical protein
MFSVLSIILWLVMVFPLVVGLTLLGGWWIDGLRYFFMLSYIVPQSYGKVKGFGVGRGAKLCFPVFVGFGGFVMEMGAKLRYKVMRKNENVTQSVTLKNGLTMRVEGVL